MGTKGKSKTNKRKLSEAKKKMIASNQNWKCKGCGKQLDATFEVDHVVDLQFGGSNHVSNLEAKCRNCHGQPSRLRRYRFAFGRWKRV